MAEQITLEAWRTEYEQLAEEPCKWPGPRPLRTDDRDRNLLVGRDRTLRNFRRAVDDHRIILLSGTSGVGKSSLLQAGLVPHLRESGYTVSLSSQWNWREKDEPAVAFLARIVRDGFGENPPVRPVEEFEHPGEFFWELEDQLGHWAVLVLDQFEELVRYSERLARDVFELILDLNLQTSIKLVLSFRSEYLHYFRPIEDAAQPYSIAQFPLGPVDPVHARAIVLAPFDEEDPDRPDEEMVKRVVEMWEAAIGDAGPTQVLDPFDTTGLLHLQALLWNAFFHAREREERMEREPGTPQLTAADFEALVAELERRSGSDALRADPPAVFKEALNYSVEMKLRLCERAAEAKGLRGTRLNGVRAAITLIAPQVSSAGYKLVREVGELCNVALFEKIDNLKAGSRRAGADGDDPELTDAEVKALLYSLITASTLVEGIHVDGSGVAAPADARGGDVLEMDVEDACRAADARLGVDTRRPLVDRLHRDELAAKADPISVSAGRMYGSAPVHVLVQELRQFVFALVWMKESALIRVTAPEDDRLMVSLIHDGFGSALNNWAREQANAPRLAIWSDTALIGPNLPWWVEGSDRPPAELDGRGDERVLTNLRWKGCWVSGWFRNVTFVNSDFRGTIFDGCRLEGVTFANCVLDGTIFSDCTVAGAPSTGHVEEVRTSVPSFEVRADEGGRILAVQPTDPLEGPVAVRSNPGNEGAFVVAEPAGLGSASGSMVVHYPEPEGDRADARSRIEGGVLVIGGRLAYLTFRGTTIEEDSAVQISSTQGTGLAIVEQVGGKWLIDSSAIRHLTLTPPQRGEPAAAEGAPIEIRIRDSVMFQSWLGRDLRGTLDLTTSTVVHFWNQSAAHEGGELVSNANGCDVSGVRGVQFDAACQPYVADEALDLPALSEEQREELADRSALTDYRREG